jgi:hypothetical protein
MSGFLKSAAGDSLSLVADTATSPMVPPSSEIHAFGP